MIISCPECDTKFAIADAVLGERGRKVRCFKCDHAWHQVSENAPPSPPEPAPRRAAPPLMPTVGESSSLAVESIPSAPEPVPQSGRSFDLPLDSAGDDIVVDDDFEIPSIDPPGDFSALGSTKHADDETGYSAVDVDALLGSRAEDIPSVLSRRVHEEEKRVRFGRWPVVLVVIAALGFGLWQERVVVVERFPVTASIYKALGAPLEILGDGLEFRSVGSEMAKAGRTPILVVRGVIANISKDSRSVPLLRLVLLDTGGRTIQESFGKPRKDALDAGQQMGFQIRMENPSAAAVRYEVTFTEAPASHAIEPAVETPASAGQMTPA